MATQKDKNKDGAPEYDVIVIGTGLGGCAAGAISALHGFKTLILEKNHTLGGSCSYYHKQGFKVDTGGHIFVRGNAGPLGACTRRLGMGNAINFLRADPVTHFCGYNLDFTLPVNPLKWPFAGMKFLLQSKIPPTAYWGLMRMGVDIMTMPEARVRELDKMSLEAFVRQYTSDTAALTIVCFMMGLYFILPTWESSAGEAIWNTQKLATAFGLVYPRGGASAVPETILKGARNHGARVRASAPVKQIMVENGRATGVILEDGRKITARTVISTSAAKDTILKLTGAEYFPANYVDRIRSTKPSMTGIQAKIGLKKKLVQGGALVGGWPAKIGKFTTEQFVEGYQRLQHGRVGEHMPVYIPVPTNFDPALAPEGHQLLTVVAIAPNNETELVDPENVWIDRLMDAVHNLIPGSKENTVFCDIWSVQALATWIGKDSGACISTAQSGDQSGLLRLSHETPVAGLYLAGDNAGPARGIGTELACQSGMDCADMVKRHMDIGWLN